LAAIDFITALGRLLHDGALRDAFANDPVAFVRKIELRERDRTALLQLVPTDLEFQARVLLRKRFGLVQAALPETCRALSHDGWPEFESYGRANAPSGTNQLAADVWEFSQHLRKTRPETLCAHEFNRARFAQSQRRIAFHVVTINPAARAHRPGLQILVRHQPARYHEWLFCLGL
jgi:hypothetical protein